MKCRFSTDPGSVQEVDEILKRLYRIDEVRIAPVTAISTSMSFTMTIVWKLILSMLSNIHGLSYYIMQLIKKDHEFQPLYDSTVIRIFVKI
jgi:hypothetical protein